MNIDGYTEFIPPRQCPVFEPNEEEFKDPLAYIAKIRPIGEKYGICKIKPPPYWQPPFAVNIDKIKFTPRLQRLNELEATTRIKLNFLDQIAKFWDLQGCKLRIPQVDRKALDLHCLYKAVRNEGGYNTVLRDRKWAKIAVFMGYSPTNKYVGGILKQHYEKILLPYDLFKSGESLDIIKNKAKLEEGGEDERDKNYTPHAIPYRQSIKPEVKEGYTRRTKRVTNLDDTCAAIDFTVNNELKRLQFFGAGPKLPGVPHYHHDILDEECKEEIKTEVDSNIFEQMVKKSISTESKPLSLNIENVFCNTCGSGDDEECLLLCESCDFSFHTFCLMPPLKEVPKGDWRCPICISKECKNNAVPFGFEQSIKEYTLHTFGEMADEFKATYFNMPFHMVPTQVVEKEFWRLVSSIVDDVTVCYGADLHCIEHGSGFPTEAIKEKFPADEEYIYSPWNLNNLPVLNKSILKYISGDISGMKVPWMYVGMCFSTFCWHTEDHWSYSINYLHWGEPKTWYGVPGSKAEALEAVMQAQVPELFEVQKDLLHHLVTLMNPNILMAQGVPVCRADQYPGEFMVTFPRAYHAGFNQGYNLAEAVNFCPSDWIPVGRKCVSHYRTLKRYNVFSHEELMCKMAACPEHLELSIASATYDDMLTMIEEERKLRKEMFEKGVTKAEREIFELLGDDDRKCDHCNTTCFLSALTCICLPTKMSCLYHCDMLCKVCPVEDFTLKYRYTLDELPLMMKRLKAHVDYFDCWALKVKECLEGSSRASSSAGSGGKDADTQHGTATACKVSLETLRELYKESLFKKFPSNDLTTLLLKEIERAETYAAQAKNILKLVTSGKKVQPSEFVSVEQLTTLNDNVNSLSCTIEESSIIETLLDNITKFKDKANLALSEKIPDVKKLEELIDCKLTSYVHVPERDKLKEAYQVGLWLVDVRNKLAEPEKVTVGDINELMVRGRSKPKHPALDKCLKEMHEIVEAAKAWEEKAKKMLQSKPSLGVLEAFLIEIGPVPIHLPNITNIKSVVSQGKAWLNKAHYILNGEMFLSIPSLPPLLTEAHQLSITMSEVSQLETLMNFAKTWRDRAVRCFLKKNSQHTFEQVICPRAYRTQLQAGITSNDSRDNSVGGARVRKRKAKGFSAAAPAKPDPCKGDGAPQNGCGEVTSSVFDILGIEDAVEFRFNGETIQEKSTEYYRFILQAYQGQQVKEFDAILELRARNGEKYEVYKMDQAENSIYFDANPAEVEAGERFCTCQKPFSPPMLCCQLCKDWFHYNCVLSPKYIQTLTNLSNALKSKENHYPSNQIVNMDSKYLCPSCVRSRRPKLETAFSLLVSLQKIPLKTHEILILQCLTERAVKWQEKVQKFLTSEEISTYITSCKEKRAADFAPPESRMSKPSPPITTTTTSSSQRLSGPSGETNPPPIVNELWNSAVLETTCPPLNAPQQPLLTCNGEERLNQQSQLQQQPPATLKFAPKIIDNLGGSTAASFHPSSNGHVSVNTNPKLAASIPSSSLHSGAPALQRSSNQVACCISPKTVTELEMLMIEGDLIELSLHESQYLWQIYKEFKSGASSYLSATSPVLSLAHETLDDQYEIGDMASLARYICNRDIAPSGKKKGRGGKGLKSSETNDQSISKIKFNERGAGNGENCSPRNETDDLGLEEFKLTPSLSNTLNELGIGMDLDSQPSLYDHTSTIPAKPRRETEVGNDTEPRSNSLNPLSPAPHRPHASSNGMKKLHNKLKRKMMGKALLGRGGSGSNGGRGKKKGKKQLKIRVPAKKQHGNNKFSPGAHKKGTSLKSTNPNGDEHEEYTRCSLPVCMEPGGSDINWVQCDGGCEQWFHMACVGISDAQISENDDYYCYRCKESALLEEQQHYATTASSSPIH